MADLYPFTEAYLEGPQSTQFLTRTYAPESPFALIVFVHGFIDHVARYTEFHGPISKNGIAIFTYDQRGFGRTAVDETGKEKKDTGNRGYAKTSWPEQLEDLDWMVKHAHSKFPDLPLFLMGASMGGGLCLAFNTRGKATPPSAEAVALVSGVIPLSPLIHQTHPLGSVQKWLVRKMSRLMPYATFPTRVPIEHLTHDSAMWEASKSDHLSQYTGGLRGVSDMLDGGDSILARDYKNWPGDRPLIIFHGTEDEVTDPKASQEFFNRVSTKDKKIVLLEGARHEPFHEIVPEGVVGRMVNEITEWVKARAKPADARL